MNNELIFEQFQGMLLAQQAAYVALVRHLAVLNVAAPEVLAGDLRTLGSTQSMEGWQQTLESLANAIAVAESLSSAHR